MYSARLLIAICVSFFSAAVVWSAPQTRLKLSLPLSAAQEQQLVNFLPVLFPLAAVTVDADIAIDKEELLRLFDLKPGTSTTRAALLAGLVRLGKKQKFSQLVLEKTVTAAGIGLRIHLESVMTFTRVQFRGSVIGKDRYRAHYALEPGEIFDEKKHKASLEKIRQLIVAQGYCAAEVIDELVFDEPTKTVSAIITIIPHQRFIITPVTSRVIAKEQVTPADARLLADRTKRLLNNVLHKSYYEKSAIDAAARTLHDYLINKGFFSHLITLEETVREDGTVAIEFVMQVAHKNVFEFHGNKFFSRRQLLDQLLLFGKSVELIPPSLIAEELVAIYKKEGFWNVAVTWQDDGERTFFFITEGKRIGISAVQLLGVTVRDADALIAKHFKKLIAASYFTGDVVKQALDALGADYLEQGFWDFAVQGYDYRKQGDETYILEVTVHEGKQRFLKAVNVEAGFGVEHEAAVQRYASIPCPIPFNIRLIGDQRQLLLKALQKKGRLYMRPQPELQEHADGITLIWKFVGPQTVVHFGDTIVLGANKLPAKVMLRELAYSKGDVWDQQKIEQSVLRLKDLAIFDMVSLAPEDLATPTAEKTLLLRVLEDTPYEVRARLGIQGVNRNIIKFSVNGISYKAGGSFLYKNPFNQGDLFRFDVDFSRFMHDIIASYSIPWLFNAPIRTEFKGYSSRYDQPVVIGSPDVLYRAAQDGGLVGFTGNWRSCDFGINLGVEWLQIDPAELLPPRDREVGLAHAIQLDRRLIGSRFPYLFFEPTIFYSTQDNKIQPTRGILSLLSVKGMIPPTLSDAACFKIILEQSGFIPVGNSLVVALRARCGTMFNAPIQRIMPIERFFLGGAFSIRSYEPDLVPPLNPFLDAQGQLRLVPVGGKSMVNLNAELRFPLYGSLSGVTFFDIGALSQQGISALQRADVATAAGFGVRWNTGVGPIRFDIGWKLNKPTALKGFQEKSYAWFLSFGNAF